MTMAAQEPVVSGQLYMVTEVDGRPPAGLASCVGERALTLAMNGLSHRMFGTGVEHSARVRFHQKVLGPADRTSGCGRSAMPVTIRCSPSIAPRPAGRVPDRRLNGWVAGNPVRGEVDCGFGGITLMPGPLPRNPPT